MNQVMLDDEVEILHLHKRMELDGDIYDREIAFMSDHQIFHRICRNGDCEGWSYWRLWNELKEVYETARLKASRGWEVDWHPSYNPGMNEFTREVKF